MGFAMGSSHLLQSYFPFSSCSSSSFPSHSHSVIFHVKNCDGKSKRKKRAAIVACTRQEDPDSIIFSKKRAVLFVGIWVLPFLQLRARALEGSITSEFSYFVGSSRLIFDFGIGNVASFFFFKLLNRVISDLDIFLFN